MRAASDRGYMVPPIELAVHRLIIIIAILATLKAITNNNYFYNPDHY